ncbi:MAG: hypothetical protein Q9183_002979 [Haloplaca sp. 2 TL-2023]
MASSPRRRSSKQCSVSTAHTTRLPSPTKTPPNPSASAPQSPPHTCTPRRPNRSSLSSTPLPASSTSAPEAAI